MFAFARFVVIVTTRTDIVVRLHLVVVALVVVATASIKWPKRKYQKCAQNKT